MTRTRYIITLTAQPPPRLLCARRPAMLGLETLFMRHALLALLLPLAVTAAARADTPLLEDLSLRDGFRLSAVSTAERPLELGTVLAGAPDAQPRWRLAQWGTRWNLLPAPETVSADGARTRRNEGKRVTVLPGGLAGEGVVLGVNGPAEYPDGPRKHGEPWPHLLVEQKITREERLTAWSALPFRVSFRVERCDGPPPGQADPGLHTAHITAFWTAHNGNQDSAGRGDMLWFGVPLFDARHPLPPGHQAEDGGQPLASHKFIYTVEGSRVQEGPVRIGEWRTISCDILPLLREALETAATRGFMKDSRFGDLRLTSFNLGWEVPGSYDCEITLKGLSLGAVPAVP